MAEVEILNVEKRQALGKHQVRRLRQSGTIPAVLYGHGEESVSLQLAADDFATALRHGARVVKLQGAVTQQALIRDVQWDTWGQETLHVDFTRISAHEKVVVEVPVELRGEAPGVKQGGIVEQVLHSLEFECEATVVPERIDVNINSLELGDSVAVKDLELPRGATVTGELEQTVVHCIEPAEEPEEGEEAAGEAEPEVIGRAKEEEEEEGSAE
jgi:large subunit ribosomal protein L25